MLVECDGRRSLSTIFPAEPDEQLASVVREYQTLLKNQADSGEVKGGFVVKLRVCMQITEYYKREANRAAWKRTCKWPTNINFQSLAQRVVHHSQTLTGLIENGIVLAGSDAWKSFLTDLAHAKLPLREFAKLNVFQRLTVASSTGPG